jgi:hypothetical protein
MRILTGECLMVDFSDDSAEALGSKARRIS